MIAICRNWVLAVAAVLALAGAASAQDASAFPEMTLGAADAPVTIIEYASMSCPHCATFHADTYPELKKRYVDSGRVRFVFREFPLNAPAFQASVLARCGGPSRYFGFIDVLFRELPVWAEAADPLAELARIGRLGGVSAEAFEACLQDERLTEGILGNRLTGEQEHGVSSTPSFVVNGRLLTGVLDIAQFEGIIEPLLAGAAGGGESAAQPLAAAPAPAPASSWPIWAIVALVAAAALALGGWLVMRRRGAAAGR